MLHHIFHGRGFIAAMRHALRALRIAAVAVFVPWSIIQQLLETGCIPFIRKQIARLLPTENVACRISPGRALIVLVARKKIEIKRRVIQLPFTGLAYLENAPEEILGILPLNEDILPGSVGVGSATIGPVVFGPLMDVRSAFSGCCSISSTAVAS